MGTPPIYNYLIELLACLPVPLLFQLLLSVLSSHLVVHPLAATLIFILVSEITFVVFFFFFHERDFVCTDFQAEPYFPLEF